MLYFECVFVYKIIHYYLLKRHNKERTKEIRRPLPADATKREEMFAGTSSPFLLSLPFLLFLLSLSSLLLSPFCFQKPIWESVRQENSHMDGMESIQGQFAGCGRVWSIFNALRSL